MDPKAVKVRFWRHERKEAVSMYQEISQLLMYGDLDEDSILYQMGEIFGKYETGEYNKTGLVRDINT